MELAAKWRQHICIGQHVFACWRGIPVNLQTIIYRELRAAARRRETWRLRLVFGIAATLAFTFGMLLPQISPRERGLTVLICLAVAGFGLSLFTGAYLTADAITREKREGTLGLLFLTPLRPWEIILGKMVTHSLQVGYALLGAFPVFFLPLLLGSVLWGEVLRLLLVLALTLVLSLACGMFYSTHLRDARTAVLATMITMLLLALLPWLPPLLRGLAHRHSNLYGVAQLSPMTALIFAFDANFRLSRASVTGAGASIFWGSILCLATGLIGLVAIASGRLSQVWADTGTEAHDTEETPCPNRHRTRALPWWALPMHAAPLLWLAARDAFDPVWVKLVRGGALAFFLMMVLTSVTTNNWEVGFIAAFCTAYGLHLFTRVQLLFAATQRVHKDRECGALEAILVTPVTDAEMLQAHHEAFKRQHWATLLTILSTNVVLELAMLVGSKQLHMDADAGMIFSAFFLGGALITLSDFKTLRWVGLREALRQSSQLKAAGRAFVLTMLVPWTAFAVAWLFAMGTNHETMVALIFSAWVAACLLYNELLTSSCQRALQAGLRRLVAAS